jgi:hypothetical protein
MRKLGRRLAQPTVFLALVLLPAGAEAQERPFRGFFAGVEVAKEDFIGGSSVDGIDFLAQETRGVVSLAAGVRYETLSGAVVGVEGTLGFTDGDLTLTDVGRNLRVEYANDQQTSLGALLGYSVRVQRPWLLFAYASEVTRKFDVTVTPGTSPSFEQQDEQGMLRFGVGAEVRARDGLHVRCRIGTGRADFDDARTNITPKKRVQFGVGATYQF